MLIRHLSLWQSTQTSSNDDCSRLFAPSCNCQRIQGFFDHKTSSHKSPVGHQCAMSPAAALENAEVVRKLQELASSEPSYPKQYQDIEDSLAHPYLRPDTKRGFVIVHARALSRERFEDTEVRTLDGLASTSRDNHDRGRSNTRRCRHTSNYMITAATSTPHLANTRLRTTQRTTHLATIVQAGTAIVDRGDDLGGNSCVDNISNAT
ncbi:hypothetical protein HBI23_129810 [Parastagonospora nodorum]|nr:hypothetical protein HBI12_071220 [Parastagonospora nodorum]KAH5442949.1 hypothetical protein HBI47_029320 [Parastagonospora nodorum]KAH5660242.1 hypothetical protein HBI23_129810 [Parastagonospora nodorum]